MRCYPSPKCEFVRVSGPRNPHKLTLRGTAPGRRRERGDLDSLDVRRSRPALVALRLAVLVLATALAIAPLASVLARAVLPGPGGGPIEAFTAVLRGPGLLWLGNSLLVCLSTVLATLVVGAPAAYVLARARGRLVSAYAIALFALQSVPVILLLVPLFVILARVGLVDDLQGLVVVYVGVSLAVVIWMLSASVSTIPVEIEEAAWLDGSSVLGGFVRVVLPNALPGILSTAIFTFLTAWNEYLVAVVFIRSSDALTLAIGLQMARSPALTVVVMLPPVLLFAVLHRYFSLGGIGGSIAGR